ncbi:MAG: dihydroorotate dehydrogenase electron transfer subunit [Oscillibacter sp.]|nr:dihydroorotate dehydrogenase electron transfer subunit [Oscillibacter sp.]
MREIVFEITENAPIAAGVYRMSLRGDARDITRPGQFVNIRLDGFFLRRPISVCDRSENSLTLIYKILGRGTEAMSRMRAGETLDVLSGLGNGYDTAASGMRPLLIGGGVGVPPLYMLAKELLAQGKAVRAVLGFNSACDVFYAEEFAALGCEVAVTTVDGSFGRRGFVTDALPEDATYFYACGPEAMLRAVYRATAISGEFSFEERMGCGFGACMGCTCKTVSGSKRICRDGPVLKREEILWQN